MVDLLISALNIFLFALFIALSVLIAFALLIIISSFFIDKKSEFGTENRYYRFLLNTFTAVGLVFCRVKIRTSGMDKLPTDGKFLLVCNHKSKFDPIVTWLVLRQHKIAFISKPENFKVPVFGRIIRKCNFMPIDRENPMAAMRTVAHAAKLISSGTNAVGVYPEGTRGYKDELLPFHHGVFLAAKRADAPCVVMTVKNTDKIKSNFPKRTDIYLDIHEVISSEYIKKHKTNEIGDMAYNIMNDALYPKGEDRK